MMIHHQLLLPQKLLHIVVTSKILLSGSPLIPCYSEALKMCGYGNALFFPKVLDMHRNCAKLYVACYIS